MIRGKKSAVIGIAACAVFACKGEDKKQQSESSSTDPTQAGEINVDTNTEETVDDTKKDEGVAPEATQIYVAGQVAITTALRLTDAPEKKADKVFGFKLPAMNDGWRQMPEVKVVDVAADGSFKFPFTKSTDPKQTEVDRDWVLVLVDSKQTRRQDKFVGFLGINDGGDGLIRFPMSTAKADVALGKVTPPDVGFDTALSEATLDDVTKSFALEKAALALIAKTDSVLRNVKNQILNVDLDKKTFGMATPAYTWKLDPDVALQADDADGKPATLAQTSVKQDVTYTCEFRNTQGFVGKAEFCDKTTAVHVDPPGEDGIFGQSNNGVVEYETFSNSGAAILDTSIGTCAFNHDGAGGGGLTASESDGQFRLTVANGLEFQAGNLPPIPEGYWTLEAKKSDASDFTELGAFDLSATSPFIKNGTADVPLMYVPTVRVIKGGDGKVTGVELKFWYHDGTKMAQVQDIGTLFSDKGGLLDVVYFYFTDFSWNCEGATSAFESGKRCEAGANVNAADVAALTDKSKIVVTKGLEKGWEYHTEDGGAGDTPVLDMDRFSINYEVAGVGFVWTW